MDRRRGKTPLILVAVLSTAAIAFVAYSPILQYFFTGTDTLTLIETSRINSLDDVFRIFTEPLMAGTRFEDTAKFYRPLASLSYGLDYFLWKLEPFGFHLTDLGLHVLVSVLVVLLLRSLFGGDTVAAWVGGLIFATHPILAESIPAIDRRHDMLALLFILMSLLAVRTGSARTAGKTFLILSLISYVLALASKEIAIVLPFLVLGQCLLCRSGARTERLVGVLKTVVPYVLVTFLYIAWRIHILGSLGGYKNDGSADILQAGFHAANIAHSYVLDLLYPVNFLGLSEPGYGLTACLIIALTAYLALYAFHATPKDQIGHEHIETGAVAYLAEWLILPLILFELTATFAHRNMCLSVVPLSGLLACTVVGSARRVRMMVQGTGAKLPSCLSPALGSRLVVLALGLSVTGSLVAYSPLVHWYKGWEDSARISYLFLTKLVATVPSLPRDCAIHLCDLPDRIQSHSSRIPHAKDVAYLQDYSIKSWLNLKMPGNAWKVRLHARSWPRKFHGTLNLSVRVFSRTQVWAFVRIGKTGYRDFQEALSSRRNSATQPGFF